MPFLETERNVLLAVKGIGPTVVKRLEEMGYGNLAKLAAADMLEIVSHGAAMTGSTKENTRRWLANFGRNSQTALVRH